MKLSNGTEVIIKPFCEEDAEEIVRLIIRNFREVNVKDYGEETISALSATHDVNWFKGVAEYAHVYVFWNKDKNCGRWFYIKFLGKFDGKYLTYYFCAA